MSISGARSRTARGAVAAALLVAAGIGCGLLEDATTFTIDTDWKTITVDSDALGLTVPSGATIPAVSCTKTNDICAKGTSVIKCTGQGTAYACAVQCGDKATCEVSATAEINTSVDISQKVKSQTSASVLSKVTFDRMVYNTVENTLTFDTPTIEIFVGPNTATKTTDAGVTRFATMASIPKGQKPNALVNATEEGKNALSAFVKAYQVPFKFFVKATLRFASGDPIPHGKLTLNLKAYLEITPLS